MLYVHICGEGLWPDIANRHLVIRKQNGELLKGNTPFVVDSKLSFATAAAG